jgi:hypothetical protein
LTVTVAAHFIADCRRLLSAGGFTMWFTEAILPI